MMIPHRMIILFPEPLPAQNNFATENVLDFGGDTLSTQDMESITTLDNSDDAEKADSILNIGQPEPQPAPEPIVEVVPEPEPQPAPEPVAEVTPEPVDVDSQLSDMANSIVSEENEEQILSTAAGFA